MEPQPCPTFNAVLVCNLFCRRATLKKRRWEQQEVTLQFLSHQMPCCPILPLLPHPVLAPTIKHANTFSTSSSIHGCCWVRIPGHQGEEAVSASDSPRNVFQRCNSITFPFCVTLKHVTLVMLPSLAVLMLSVN